MTSEPADSRPLRASADYTAGHASGAHIGICGAQRQTSTMASVHPSPPRRRRPPPTGHEAPVLAEAIGTIAAFLSPVTSALMEGQPFEQHWLPGGPWRPGQLEQGE
jgi:hypothetical protein